VHGQLSTKMATKRNLVDLPPELHQDLLECFRSYLDLKSLCLTCKTLQRLATPKLYRCVILQVSDINETIHRSLNQANPGLAHTRLLRVEEWHENFNFESQGESLCRLIYAFPMDSLENLDVASLGNVPLQVTVLIHFKQRRLQNLLLHHQSRGRSVAPLLCADDFQNVSSLTLVVSSQGNVQRGHQLLKRISHIEDLAIYVHFPTEWRSQVDATASVDILSTIFESWLDSTVEKPKLRLNKLILSGFSCQHIAEILTSILIPEQLEHLSLQHCEDNHMALSSLSRAKLKLKSFDGRACHLSLGASEFPFETFLESFQGLQRLKVSIEHHITPHMDFPWKALRGHAKALRLLDIDDTGENDDPYANPSNNVTWSAYHELCSKCEALEQLVIQTSPPVDGPGFFPSVYSPLLNCLSCYHA
ncbi:hypothetical protein LTR37_017316, partial [Vermiconidia calcicola]